MKAACALLAGIGAAVALVSTGSVAVASCARSPAGPPSAESPIAFVGTVTATANGDRTATVHVEEVWRGGALPAEVTVRGSPADGSNTATDVDRKYTQGARYLFEPFGGASPFDDNACSGTVLFTPGVASRRPAEARAVAAPATAGSPPSAAIAAGAVIAVLCVGGLGWMRLRRRAPAVVAERL